MQMVQAVDLRPHAIKQLPHIGMPSVDMKAIGRSIHTLVACLRAIDQQLLGHATSDHAGAADAVTLEDGHLGAMACRTLGGCKSTEPRRSPQGRRWGSRQHWKQMQPLSCAGCGVNANQSPRGRARLQEDSYGRYRSCAKTIDRITTEQSFLQKNEKVPASPFSPP